MFGNKSILICMSLSPTYQSDTRIVTLLEDWAREVNVTTFYPSSGDTQVGRDKAVQLAMYMRPRPEYILFIDYDVLPRFSTLKKLLGHDKDIISGVYPMSQKCKIEWCLSKEEPFKAMRYEDLPNNPFKAKTICNGIMLVKTEVFDNLEWPYWDKDFKEGMLKTGEDIYFCAKAREAGYDLWVDPKLKCSHFKLVDLLGIARNYKKGNKQ